MPYPAEQEFNVFSTSSKAALTLVVAALVVACILSCRLLVRRGVGDEDRYCVGDKVPLMSPAALGGLLDLRGDEREEKRFLALPVASEAKERTEERPGTVLMGEEEDAVPLELPNTFL